MGREINCHHGHFDLPSDIFGVELGEDHITFDCEDGIYTATRETRVDSEGFETDVFMLRKVKQTCE